MKINFETMIEKLTPQLRGIAKKLNANFTFFDEQDLYQEALFYLWQKNRAQILAKKTDSYILQSCYFFLKNYIRKVYKRIDFHSVSLDDNLDLRGNNKRSYTSFLEDSNIFFNTLNAHIFIQAITTSLNKREKEVFRLCLDGFTVREIGKILGVSHVMVVKIKKRIINKCKTLKE